MRLNRAAIYTTFIVAEMLAACGTAPAQPTINTETGVTPVPLTVSPQDVSMSAPSTPVPDSSLIDPVVRATAMEATAQSVMAKGAEGLVGEGFPIEAISSQRKFALTWMFNLTKDGTTQASGLSFNCDATAVNVPSLNAFILLGATHCTDPNYQTSSEVAFLQQQNPGSVIEVRDMNLFSLGMGSSNLVRGQFGVATVGQPEILTDHNTQDGLTVIYIPKDNLSQADRDQLEKDALPLEKILLSEPPMDAGQFGYCTPGETTTGAVVMENGVITKNEAKVINVAPYLAGPGCSGSGIFAKDSAGNVYMDGVLIGSWPWDPNLNSTAVVYKLSATGQNGFLQQVTAAQYDWQNNMAP